MKTKTLKTRLLAAALTLVMLIGALAGTTFAWFTDNVTSAGNKIQTGTLQMDLLHKTDADWVSLKQNADHKVFDYDKWEPGYTRVETLQVTNLGSLALQYRLSLAVAEGSAVLGKNGENLANVIEVYVIYGERSNETSFADIAAENSGWVRKGTLSEVIADPATFLGGELLPTGKVLPDDAAATTTVGLQFLTIALHMQENAGNEYQALSVGDIYVNLIATQWSFEQDSFGADYDNGAMLPPSPGKWYTSSAQVVTDAEGKTTGETTVGGDNDKGSATIPAGVQMETGAAEATLDITVVSKSDAVVELGTGDVLFPLDVHMAGVSKDNTVPIIIAINQVFPKGLASYNVKLVHVENGVSVAMTAVDSLAELDAHNEFYYDPATGKVSVAMATFSEVTGAVAVENPWDGTTVDTSWYNTTDTEFVLEDAADLAGFAQIVGGMAAGIARDSFAGKTVKLNANLNMGGTNGKIFTPIGYYFTNDANENGIQSEGAADVFADVYAFEGTFDAQGHTIANILQRTWDIKGDDPWYSLPAEQYYNDGMGLFGWVLNGTVKNLVMSNFQSDGEYCTTGCVAAYAAGISTFDNIRITNCNPRAYNVPNGGVVGYAYDEADIENKTTFNKIVVDPNTKITALWGSWDVGCGGILGRLGDSAKLEISNCTVAAIMDVYNDVCANYQYYDFRYAGMLIGTVGSDGDPSDQVPNMTFSNIQVYFGAWSYNYHYYCELVENSIASYTNDYQFSRLTMINSVSELRDLEGEWNRTGNFVLLDEKGVATCYHIRKNENGDFYQHLHEDNGYETVNGESVLVENNQCVHIPFKQLYTGYGWGATSVAANTNVAEAKYLITYVYEGQVVDVVYVTDNSKAVSTANGALESAINNSTGGVYVFDAWVNAGGQVVAEIAANNTENVTLYVTWKNYHIARFVDQFGNVLYEAAFERGDTAIIGEPAVPEIPYFHGAWEDYSEKLKNATGDIVIYPVYTVDSSLLVLTPVDSDSDGDVDYYEASAVNMIGTDGVVNIPGYINGIPIKVITSLSANAQGNVTMIEVQEGVEVLTQQAFAYTPNMTEVWLPSTINTIGQNTFTRQGGDFKSDLTIHFNGTKAQWDAIKKENDWGKGMEAGCKIICTDGIYTCAKKHGTQWDWTPNTTN